MQAGPQDEPKQSARATKLLERVNEAPRAKAAYIHLMTKQDVAEELGKSVQMVEHYAAKGTGPEFKYRHGKRVYCTRVDFEEFQKVLDFSANAGNRIPLQYLGRTMRSARAGRAKYLLHWRARKKAAAEARS